MKRPDARTLEEIRETVEGVAHLAETGRRWHGTISAAELHEIVTELHERSDGQRLDVDCVVAGTAFVAVIRQFPTVRLGIPSPVSHADIEVIESASGYQIHWGGAKEVLQSRLIRDIALDLKRFKVLVPWLLFTVPALAWMIWGTWWGAGESPPQAICGVLLTAASLLLVTFSFYAGLTLNLMDKLDDGSAQPGQNYVGDKTILWELLGSIGFALLGFLVGGVGPMPWVWLTGSLGVLAILCTVFSLGLLISTASDVVSYLLDRHAGIRGLATANDLMQRHQERLRQKNLQLLRDGQPQKPGDAENGNGRP